MSMCPDCEGEGFKEYDAGLVQIWCKTCESTGKVDCELTKEEFEKAYAFRSDMTPGQVAEMGLVAMPCACGEDGCKGWAMQNVSNIAEKSERPDEGPEETTITIGIGKVNLCDTCSLSIPECNAQNVEYGDGVGNDNVIKCDTFTTYVLTGTSEVGGEIIGGRELRPGEYVCSTCSQPADFARDLPEKTVIHRASSKIGKAHKG